MIPNSCGHRGTVSRRLPLLVVLLPALWFGCRGEGGHSPNTVAAELSTKCEEFASALCSKQAACVGAGGDTSACVADAVGPQRFDCGSVTRLSATYDKCLRDISQSKCPLALPSSCKDVLGRGGAPQSVGGADAGAGKDATSGSGSFKCYVAGYYDACVGSTCDRRRVDSYGFGSTQADAEAMGIEYCNESMMNFLVINNIGGLSRLIAPCTVVACDSI
jgi:hypothetical protein